ncbi:PKD domain-containing protein [Aquimarina sp. 2304DJ70-9]|uniref:PKD domain-containing protein n=1 Tax=Aquimarina penaris TaxID=3231044 RepID=UPI0034620669
MKKIVYILSIFSFLNCAKEEAVPVFADFEFEVFNDDFSIPVQVVFFNRTEGGEDYEWSFEGGVPSRSVERNPGVIQYNEKGVYSIELTASNQDGSVDTKVLEIQIDDPVIIDFEITNLIDNFSPASFTFQNNSMGADSYSWTFEGGTPASSNEQNPGEVVFIEPGEHTIRLEISNGRETYDLEKIINVAPFLIAGFDSEVAFVDDDFQIPVRIQFQNNSISATSYDWSFEGGTPRVSTEENPEVIFTETGVKTVTFRASNGKDTKTITQQFNFFANTNLRELKDIRLGINTAHSMNTVGSFYSVNDRKVYTKEEITSTPTLGEGVDLVFFGLDDTFERNRFVSPDKIASDAVVFESLQNPKTTIFINSQELCNCSASLTSTQFDAMQTDALLKNLTIEETPGGLQAFDDMTVPRIVLFQMQDGRKGAVKIKNFVADGQNSYISVDIKAQKEPN